MAWTWMEDDEIVTDFFRRRLVTSTEIKRFGIEAVPLEEQFGAFEGAAPFEVPMEEPEWQDVPGLEMQPDWRESEKASFIANYKDVREAELVQSAPTERVPGLQEDWHGEWMQVPSIDGEPTPRVLLAASDQRRRRKASKDAQGQKVREARNIELEVSSDGHLLFAIDWRSRPMSEAGEELNRLIALDSDPE